MVLTYRSSSFLLFLLPLAACGRPNGPAAPVAANAGAAGEAVPGFLLPASSFVLRETVPAALSPRISATLPGGAVSWAEVEPERFIARIGGEQWILAAGNDVRFDAPGDALVALSTKPSGAKAVRRHMKTVLTVVGRDGAVPPSSAAVTARVGLELEITPVVDPSALELGSDLPVRVHFHGPSLKGVEVLAWREGEAAPKRAMTGGAGDAVFRIDRGGRWLVSVEHRAGGEIHIASLLFAAGREAGR